MQIALLSAEYPPQPGGVGDYTRRLGQALVKRGHDVHVYTICDSRFQIINVASANTEHETRLDNQGSDWGWGSWRHVIAALDLTRPDVLHIQYQTGAYQMRPAINLLPWRLGGLSRHPAIVVTAHDLLLPYLFPKAGPLRAWITRRLLADADAVIVTNQADFAKIAN
jgi:glycosyltransferase involved in cell wall biosynthesis